MGRQSWPTHNHDLANTRATTSTPINSQTVSKLKVKWRFTFKGLGASGAFASSPIVLHNTVYLQDLDSNVYALQRSDGKLLWEHFSTSRMSGQTASPTGRSAVRCDRDEGLRARPGDRQDAVEPEADPQQQRGHRHGAASVRQHGARQHGARQRVVVLQGQWGRRRVGPRCRHRQAQVAVQHGLRRREALGSPVGQQRRRHLVPTRRRQPGACLPLGGQPGTAVRDTEVPKRVEPPVSRSLHGFARRAQRSDRQAALVSASDRARPPRLRPCDPGDPDDLADPGSADADRDGGGQDGEGLRLPI